MLHARYRMFRTCIRCYLIVEQNKPSRFVTTSPPKVSLSANKISCLPAAYPDEKQLQTTSFPAFIDPISRLATLLVYLDIRAVEDLLAERSNSASYEAIQLWIYRFGPEFTKRLRRRHSDYNDT